LKNHPFSGGKKWLLLSGLVNVVSSLMFPIGKVVISSLYFGSSQKGWIFFGSPFGLVFPSENQQNRQQKRRSR